MAADTAETLTAERYVERLSALKSDAELQKIQRYFKSGKGDYGEGDQFLGVRMGDVFRLSKEFALLPLEEIEKLLDSPLHEVRAGGVKVMQVQAAAKKTTDAHRKDLFDLYLRRIDRINNWDLVDLGAPDVVGRYLFDRPRDLIFKLAESENLWERRTAIVATFHFAKQKDFDDGYRIAEILLHDPHDLIHKPVGGFLRWAGQSDQPRLLAFLDRHAATMPRTALRYAIEHLEPNVRRQYLGLGKGRPA